MSNSNRQSYTIHDKLGNFDIIIKKERKPKREPNKLVNLPEEQLIAQVEIRPILYDKSLKGYRKSALRNQSWNEIASLIGSSVEECRKRWRSLRDAFSKHYKTAGERTDMTSNAKRKKWIFYDQMYFIAPYLDNAQELEINDDNNISDLQDTSHESLILHDNDDEQHLEDDENVTYKTEPVSESHHVHHHHDDVPTINMNEDSQFISQIFASPTTSSTYQSIDETTPITTMAGIKSNSQILSLQDAQVLQGSEEYSAPQATTLTVTPSSSTSTSGYLLDSEEKFLLSCSPILKRLSPRKNALARLKIQQILFEIEFGDQ